MRAVLLAAGFATRLYPLTRDRAKPLLDVAGRPVLSWILDRLLELDDLREVVVVANAKFAAQFERWRDDLGVSVPVHVLDDGATDDADKLGGVADMGLALRALRDGGADDVVVLAGDNLVDSSLRPHAARFKDLAAPLMIARTIEGIVPPGRYGEVTIDDAGRITCLREKPADPQTDLTATCMYFFTPAARRALDDYLAGDGERDAPGHFIAWLVEHMPVYANPYAGTLYDIGNLESLEHARASFHPRA